MTASRRPSRAATRSVRSATCGDIAQFQPTQAATAPGGRGAHPPGSRGPRSCGARHPGVRFWCVGREGQTAETNIQKQCDSRARGVGGADRGAHGLVLFPERARVVGAEHVQPLGDARRGLGLASGLRTISQFKNNYLAET